MRVTCCQKNFPTFASALKAFLSPDFGGVCFVGSPSVAANSWSGGAMSSSPRFAVKGDAQVFELGDLVDVRLVIVAEGRKDFLFTKRLLEIDKHQCAFGADN